MRSIEIQAVRLEGEQFFFAAIAQHGDQCRVHIQELSFWRAEVHTLLQRLEKLRKAFLFLALIGNVVAEDAYSHHLIHFDDGIKDTIEVENPRAVLELDRNHPGPAPPFQKAPQACLYILTGRSVTKLVELVAHNFGVGHAKQIRKPPIHGAECAVQRNRTRHVVEGVDQFLEAPLRAEDHLAELVELIFGWGHPHPVLQVLQQNLEFGDLSPSPVRVGCKQHGENQQSRRDSAQVVGDGLEALPHKDRKGNRQEHHEQQSEPPQPGFFLLQVARGTLRTRGIILFRSHKKFSRTLP